MKQGHRVRARRHRDEDAFADLARVGRLRARRGEQARHPAEPELAQAAQRLDRVERRRGGIDLTRRAQPPMRQSPPQRLRCHVDQLDLVGAEQDPVRHRWGRRPLGDRGDDFGQRGHSTYLGRGKDIDPCLDQLLDRLPAGAPCRRVDRAQVVDGDDPRPSLQQRRDVQGTRLTSLGPDHEGLQGRPAMRVGDADDDVRPSGTATGRLGEHGVGRPDPGRDSDIHAQPATRHTGSLLRCPL
jgi:hypothetical protein